MRILEKYLTDYPEDESLSLEQVRLRNPKFDDMGEVMADGEQMENFYLFDEKEFYL